MMRALVVIVRVAKACASVPCKRHALMRALLQSLSEDIQVIAESNLRADQQNKH
jgi:hypothetical protein